MAMPRKCPICGGSGQVAAPRESTLVHLPCDACGGTGIVWETADVVIVPVYQQDAHATG